MTPAGKPSVALVVLAALLPVVASENRSPRTPPQRSPRDTYVLYFDGGAGSGWEILPDLTSADLFKTTGTAVELAGGELLFAKRYLSGFDLTMWLADRRGGYTVASPDADVLRIEHDGSATGSAGVSLADPDRPVPAEMHYSPYIASTS